MLLILVLCTLAAAKSVENTFDDITRQWELREDAGNAQPAAKATRVDRPVSMATNKAANDNRMPYKKHQFKRKYDILQTCYSGDLYETVKALGVFKIPGIKMVKVSGELYQLLLKNHTVKLTLEQSKMYEVDMTSLSESYDIPRAVNSDSSITKRATDICEEDAGVLIILAHASGQFAYVATDYGCASSVCSYQNVAIGSCQKKIQTFLIWLVNVNGDFISNTVEIGCACECIV